MTRAFLAAALILAAQTATAQDRMTSQTCTQSFDTVAALLDTSMTAPPVQLADDGWCDIRDLKVAIDPSTTVRIGSLRWRASDIARLIAEGLPPRSLELVGQDVGVVPDTGDAVFDYLLGLQMAQTQMSFGATVRWDGVQNAVLLDGAYLQFDDQNRIDMSARIEGINLTDTSTIQTSLGTMGLRDLTVKSEFVGWFEQYLAMTLGPMILTDAATPPDVQVLTLRRQAIEFMASLPPDFMPTPSDDALAEFIRALPTPRGSAQVQLSAQPPIGVARFAPLAFGSSTGAVADVLDGVTVLFLWTPKAPTQ